jgi:diphthamide synthase subunit DPH2
MYGIILIHTCVVFFKHKCFYSFLYMTYNSLEFVAIDAYEGSSNSFANSTFKNRLRLEV